MDSQADTKIISELLAKSLIFRRAGHHNPYLEDKCQISVSRAITILVKIADWDEDHSDSDADFSEPEFPVC